MTDSVRRCIADRDWLTVFQLPPYAPDLNPVEASGPPLRRTITANRAFADPDDLITAVRRGLRQSSTAPTSSTAASPAQASEGSHHDDIKHSRSVCVGTER
ncbi:transposase [Streptomyces sp. DSM 41931]|uniref:transposase n=1 Tax=Streptomyces TaxID=1883 RepID=UPI003D06DAAE